MCFIILQNLVQLEVSIAKENLVGLLENFEPAFLKRAATTLAHFKPVKRTQLWG